MLTPVFRGCVLNGRLSLDRAPDFWRHVRSLEGRVELVVRRQRVARSTRQNSYYWGVVVPLLGEHFGYLPEAMHEALKHLFLREESPDRPLPLIRSTASLSVQEFEAYLDTIRLWAGTEHQIVIPLPNEVEAA